MPETPTVRVFFDIWRWKEGNRAELPSSYTHTYHTVNSVPECALLPCESYGRPAGFEVQPSEALHPMGDVCEEKIPWSTVMCPTQPHAASVRQVLDLCQIQNMICQSK